VEPAAHVDLAECAPGDATNPACLTSSEIAVAKAIYDGPGVGPWLRGPLPGGEGGGQGWNIWLVQNLYTSGQPTLQYAFVAGFFRDLASPSADFRAFDFATGAISLPTREGFTLPADLDGYSASGGKLLLWHGYNDPVISPLISIELFEGIGKTLGPVTRDDFLRLYMLPGVNHCQVSERAPYRFDALTALERWIEQRTRPDELIATNPTRGMSRPLCPYPQRARLIDPNGSTTDAANFQCQ